MCTILSQAEQQPPNLMDTDSVKQEAEPLIVKTEPQTPTK